jgi:hypothetical protein
MSRQTAVNLNNPAEVRRAGLSALNKELGPAGMTIFLQQFENGSGDYTKEKYETPDTPIDELAAQLKAMA